MVRLLAVDSKLGIKILEKMFNNNLQQLDSEIDKICTYIDEKKKVELKDIKKVISRDRRLKENEIFELLDAISNRKKQKSVYLYQHMITSGKVPQIIFAMITRRMKLMLIIKDLKAQGMNPKAIANKIEQHPYPVKKIYKYVDTSYFLLSPLGPTYRYRVALEIPNRSQMSEVETSSSCMRA